MNNFKFYNRTNIVFGENTEEQVGKLTKAEGKKVLLHYGGGSIKKSGLYDKVIKSLKDEAVDYVELGGVVANPRVSMVREGIRLCREEGIDFILAVGGGSVIDSAKGIAAGYYYNGDVWDLYEGLAPVENSLPIGTVLTIPAAGSESSTGSVVSNEELQLKKDIGHISLRPVFSILNPKWTLTLPDYQTACGITDMLAHVMERYFTHTKHVEVSDELCEGMMRSIINTGRKLMKNPESNDLRGEIMWAGTLAHNDLVGMGRDHDWGSHMIEHEISAIYDIAHGAGLAIVFPAWIKFVYHKDMPRFARWANRVFNIPMNPFKLEETIIEGIEALENYYTTIGMPTRLSHADISAKHLDEMARKVTNNGENHVGGFGQLTMEEVRRVLELAK